MLHFNVFFLAVFLIFKFHYGVSLPKKGRPTVFIDRAAVSHCTHFGADITPYTTDPYVKECKCLGPGLLSCGRGVNTIEPRHTKCKQESHAETWDLKDGCNWCYCDNGYAYCTSMRCKKKMKLGQYGGCKKSGRFMHEDGCNWCFCDKDFTICSRMMCAAKKKLITDSETCENKPQRRFKSEDGCNWCYCIDHNTPICTQMQCFKPNTQTQKMRKNKTKPTVSKVCKDPKRTPGKFLHEDGCNWCYCIGPKIMACTIMKCPQLMKRASKKGSKLSNIIMEHSDTIMKPGKLALSSKKTLKAKSLKEMAQSCKAGNKFKDPFGCNWCNCIEDGVVVCEQKQCG